MRSAHVAKGSARSNGQLSRRKLGLLLAGVVVMILVAGGLMAGSGLLTASQCRGKASSPLYNEAATAIKSGRYNEMKDVVDKIQKQRNYKRDANCLYPVFAYYNFVENFNEAEKNYHLLQGAYKSDPGFAKAYQPLGITDLSDVEAYYNNLKAAKERSNGTTIFFD